LTNRFNILETSCLVNSAGKQPRNLHYQRYRPVTIFKISGSIVHLFSQTFYFITYLLCTFNFLNSKLVCCYLEKNMILQDHYRCLWIGSSKNRIRILQKPWIRFHISDIVKMDPNHRAGSCEDPLRRSAKIGGSGLETVCPGPQAKPMSKA
jgi:hypothetical protein